MTPPVLTLVDAVIRAHVRNGRLVLDEHTDLPEGTELKLVAIVASNEQTPTRKIARVS